METSEEVCQSYLEKANNCIISARLLLENSLYENSVGMSYYAMYNSLTALLFRTGIKCENHAGAILLLKLLFDENKLFEVISEAKKERIDKQYYVPTEQDEITEDITEKLLSKSEDFVVDMKLVIKRLSNGSIDKFRKKFDGLVG